MGNDKVKWSIMTKLSIFFLIMLTFSLGFTGVFSHLKSIEIIEKTEKDFSYQMLREMDDAINIYLDGFEQSLYKTSNQASVQTLLAKADTISSATQTSSSTSMANNEAVMWMMKDFVSFIETHTDIKHIYLATVHKDIYSYPTKDFAGGNDATSQSWYKEAISAKRLIWTQPYLDKESNTIYISAAIPVYNNTNDNQLVGVLGIDLSLKSLSEKMNNKLIGKKGYPVVLDDEGNIIIHKNGEMIGKPVPVEEIMAAVKENSEGFVDYLWEENGTHYNKFAVFTKIDRIHLTIMTTMYRDEIVEDTRILIKNAVLVGVLAVLITMCILFFFSNRMTRSIKQLLINMEQIKQGNLTVKSNIQSNDEVGRLSNSFNITIDAVAGLIKNVQKVSKETTFSAQSLTTTAQESKVSAVEVSHAISEIASGAAQQAREAEQSVLITSNLADMINELTQNTEHMSESANEVINTMNDGLMVVNELQEKTNTNTEATERIENAIIALSNRINNIDNILQTISSIADQTNLLALNAAIEAARAGEHGKGFSVVAEEIRKLAMGSGRAAEEIQEIIQNIHKDSNKNVEIMKEVKSRSQDQNKAVIKVKDSFNGISKAIENITTKVQSEKEFVKEMNQDKEAIVEAIESISAVSEEASASTQQVTASMQQQSAAMEEIAAAAEKLKEFAMKLNQEIEKFKV